RDWSSDVCSSDLDLSDKSIRELLTMDAKNFSLDGANVEIAQINTVDASEIYEMQTDIEAEIENIVKEKDLALFLFVVTDILNNDSEVLAVGNAKNNVEQAFGDTLVNNRAFLKGVVSRKKQIVTKFTDAFTN